jgi:hypothetical protein
MELLKITPLLTADITTKTVITAAAKFEEHPAGYQPRVFVHVVACPDSADDRFLELLVTGEAVEWPRMPPLACEPGGFHHWRILAKGSLSMVDWSRP